MQSVGRRSASAVLGWAVRTPGVPTIASPSSLTSSSNRAVIRCLSTTIATLTDGITTTNNNSGGSSHTRAVAGGGPLKTSPRIQSTTGTTSWDQGHPLVGMTKRWQSSSSSSSRQSSTATSTTTKVTTDDGTTTTGSHASVQETEEPYHVEEVTHSDAPKRFITDFGIPTLVPQWKRMFAPDTLFTDISAGLTVGCIAVPLSLAIALASGVPAEVGLVTAAVSGVAGGLFGGTTLAITGPAAAISLLIVEAVNSHGLEALPLITLACGGLQLASGVTRLGVIGKLVPVSVIGKGSQQTPWKSFCIFYSNSYLSSSPFFWTADNK